MISPRTATKSSPHLPQLEEAHAQQRRPNAAKKKKKKKTYLCFPKYWPIKSEFPGGQSVARGYIGNW